MHPKKNTNSKIKTLVFILQITLVAVLLVGWLSSPPIRKSNNLWILFLYSFPAEFLIAVVPHEPILIYFGKFYVPLIVAGVAIAGTLMAEALNYSTFKYLTNTQMVQKIQDQRTVGKIIRLFQKSPFPALLIAAFTPIPFYPFRFLVVLARYPLSRYLSALLLARTPRFFILAYLGHAVDIPNYLLVALFVLLIASMNFNFLKNLVTKKQREKEKPS